MTLKRSHFLSAILIVFSSHAMAFSGVTYANHRSVVAVMIGYRT